VGFRVLLVRDVGPVKVLGILEVLHVLRDVVELRHVGLLVLLIVLVVTSPSGLPKAPVHAVLHNCRVLQSPQVILVVDG
jgi:hypothetical protein